MLIKSHGKWLNDVSFSIFVLNYKSGVRECAEARTPLSDNYRLHNDGQGWDVLRPSALSSVRSRLSSGRTSSRALLMMSLPLSLWSEQFCVAHAALHLPRAARDSLWSILNHSFHPEESSSEVFLENLPPVLKIWIILFEVLKSNFVPTVKVSSIILLFLDPATDSSHVPST